MNKHVITVKIIFVLLLMLAITSCNDEENAQGILILQSIDQVSDPFGDIISTSGTIPPDTVDITLANDPRNPSVPDTGSYSDIIIESINIIFSRLDGGQDVPVSFETPYTIRIPYNGEVTIQNFPVIPSTVKNEFPLSDLIAFGYERSTLFSSIKMRITLEVTGKTVAGDAVFVRGYTTVEVTNYAD